MRDGKTQHKRTILPLLGFVPLWRLVFPAHRFTVSVSRGPCCATCSEGVAMAVQRTRSYAISAGLSCGVGLAIPVVAYAATMPFEGVHGIVSAAAVPFAAGALAGIGVFAIAARLSDRRAAENGHDAFYAASSAREQQADDEDVQRFFGRRGAPKDVPVIARAQGAPSEREAWAEIDALLSEDSPISCDPVRSKDIYQIAFEELRRENERGARAAQPASAASDPAATAVSFPMPAVAAAAAAVAASTATAADADAENDVEAARRAALASLDRFDDAELVAETASRATAAPEVSQTDSEPSVPMADYTGHEDTWAAALAILDEPASTTASVSMANEEPVYIGKHAKNRPAALTVPTAVPPSPERAEAVAEGARATQMHNYVNSLIEEEFNRVTSQTVRRTSREYLRVIQGGTASLPRFAAEA